MFTTAILFGIVNYCLLYLSIFVFIFIFVIIYFCRRELHDISFLLTCNTCLSGLLTCIAACIMTSSNLFNGFLVTNLDFGCIWGLFYDISQCTIYHSYYLHSFYRLCRVVFYKKKYLVSYSLYKILIIVEWLTVVVLLLPPLFLNWYAHLPTENYCLIPYTYVGPEIYHILVLYAIPLTVIIIIYIRISIFIRDSSRRTVIIIAASRRQRNQRDLTILKRVVVIVSILIVLRFPTIIFLIYGIIVGDLFPLTYSIVGLITAACLIMIGLITISITPQLRKTTIRFFKCHNNRIDEQPRLLTQLNLTNPQVNIGTTLFEQTDEHDKT